MKIITTILSFFAIFCLSSCKNTSLGKAKISQLRQNAYYYECADFSLFTYPEQCENPQKDDGIKNALVNRLCFKLQFASVSPTDNCSVEFFIGDKNYHANFEYSPLSTFLYCTVFVETLPKDELYVKFNLNGKTIGANLSPLKNKTTISFDKILNNLKNNDEFVKEFLQKDDGEIKIRFIDNDGFDYWYFGFIDEKTTTSYLIDGQTGEVLAVKPEK
ncbi:MAG: hypothetical protein IJC87_04145 [Clostridia bacterium]|nr:hypothetical protein [Clostridia bacterium]